VNKSCASSLHISSLQTLEQLFEALRAALLQLRVSRRAFMTRLRIYTSITIVCSNCATIQEMPSNFQQESKNHCATQPCTMNDLFKILTRRQAMQRSETLLALQSKALIFAPCHAFVSPSATPKLAPKTVDSVVASTCKVSYVAKSRRCFAARCVKALAALDQMVGSACSDPDNDDDAGRRRVPQCMDGQDSVDDAVAMLSEVEELEPMHCERLWFTIGKCGDRRLLFKLSTIFGRACGEPTPYIARMVDMLVEHPYYGALKQLVACVAKG
jgi:hypothetical protein